VLVVIMLIMLMMLMMLMMMLIYACVSLYCSLLKATTQSSAVGVLFVCHAVLLCVVGFG
jgi:hypothetical protein